MEGAVQQVLDLQDLGQVGQKLDGDELLPGLERELEDRQRPLAGARDHALLGNAHLHAELLEAHVMAVLLHGDAAGQPLGVGRRRVGDGGLVEHLRAVELVHGMADHQLGDGLAILFRSALQLFDGLDDDGSLMVVSSDERFGVEGFEIGREVGELVRRAWR